MFTKILKSFYGKVIALTLSFAILISSQASAGVPGETVLLKAGTPIALELLTTVKSNNVKTGTIVNFKVLHDVKVAGVVVVPAGSIAKGQIVSESKNGLFGAPGELSLAVKSVCAIDGTHIPLSSSVLSSEGQDRLVASIALTVLCIFGFLIKGGQAEIVQGAQIDATVLSNVEIAVS